MKKSFVIAALSAILMTACTTKLPYVASPQFIDYQTYAAQGIFITEANSASFDYTPLGSVSVVVFPGYTTAVRPAQNNHEDLYGKTKTTEQYNKWQSADVTDAIELAVKEAKQQGGNGIINFKIQPTSETDGKIARHGFLVSGMVISK